MDDASNERTAIEDTSGGGVDGSTGKDPIDTATVDRTVTNPASSIELQIREDGLEEDAATTASAVGAFGDTTQAVIANIGAPETSSPDTETSDTGYDLSAALAEHAVHRKRLR